MNLASLFSSHSLLILFGCLSITCQTQAGTGDPPQAKIDPAARLYLSQDRTAAHLISPTGRYWQTWSLDETCETVRLSSEGELWGKTKTGALVRWNQQGKREVTISAEQGLSLLRDEQGTLHSLAPFDLAGKEKIQLFSSLGKLSWEWEWNKHAPQWAKLDKGVSSELRIQSVSILPANSLEATDKRFRAGGLLVTGTGGEMAILNPRAGSIRWASRLPAVQQVQLLPDGQLLGLQKVDGSSQWQLVSWNPITEQTNWESSAFEGKKQGRGSVAQLPNGNFLLGTPGSGILREISSMDTVVWEYHNPNQDKAGKPLPLFCTQTLTESQLSAYLPAAYAVPDFTDREEKELRRRRIDQPQYKRLGRETLFQLEVGYLDDAQRYLDTALLAHPEDEESLYTLSILQAQRGNLPAALQTAQEAVLRGLPIGRYGVELGGLLAPLQGMEEFTNWWKAQQAPMLLHGPMLGRVSADSAFVWLRTMGAQQVSVQVKDESGRLVSRSPAMQTTQAQDWTVQVPLSGLEAGSSYQYELWINQEPVGEARRFQTPPSEGETGHFSLAFAGGAGYTPRYERMWDTMATHRPLAFLSMGDNVYIDHPERPLTQQYCYYRRQSRPEFRRFSSQTAMYAIWDDHDFTYDDERGGSDPDSPYWKRDVLEVFQQNWLNPAYGGGEAQPGIWFSEQLGQVELFFLDCRYYRDDPEQAGASMLGPVQKQWLKDQLKASTATFKLIVSSVPWAKGTKPGSLDTWDGHPEEREEIFSFLQQEKIEGVVLLAADRHRSDAWRINRPDAYPLYDLMSSRLTNVHTHQIMPEALFGYNQTPSFGLLDIQTDRDDPRLTYRIISIENEEIHRLTIFRSQLEFGK